MTEKEIKEAAKEAFISTLILCAGVGLIFGTLSILTGHSFDGGFGIFCILSLLGLIGGAFRYTMIRILWKAGSKEG